MGVNFKDIIIKHEIELKDLAGKKLAVDAYNILYQFLSAIRQRDGTPLKDSYGNITSHLSGLFYRTTNLMEKGLKLCFVFDGQAPELKAKTLAGRADIKSKALEKYKKALEEKDLESARKYAQQISHLTSDMVKESKELLSAMGLPWVQAMADAEAQASYMATKGQVWAVVSQDYDSLLFGAPRLIRNLTISGKKKAPKRSTFIEVKPELVDLTATLNTLKMDRSRLVELALLIGTDFNEGVKGIGPKTAIKIVQAGEFKKYAGEIPRCEAVKNLFLKPAITINYNLAWQAPNPAKIKQILCGRHDFDEARIDSALKKIEESSHAEKQVHLGKFF